MHVLEITQSILRAIYKNRNYTTVTVVLLYKGDIERCFVLYSAAFNVTLDVTLNLCRPKHTTHISVYCVDAGQANELSWLVKGPVEGVCVPANSAIIMMNELTCPCSSNQQTDCSIQLCRSAANYSFDVNNVAGSSTSRVSYISVEKMAQLDSGDMHCTHWNSPNIYIQHLPHSYFNLVI